MPLVPHMLQALLPRRNRPSPSSPSAPQPSTPSPPLSRATPSVPSEPSTPPRAPSTLPLAPPRAPLLPRASLASVSRLHALLASNPGARLALRRVAIHASRGELYWAGSVSFDGRLFEARSQTQCAAYSYTLPQRSAISERLPQQLHVENARLIRVGDALPRMLCIRATWLLRISPVDRFGNETVSSSFMRALLSLQTQQQAVTLISANGQWFLWPVLFPLYGLCLVAVFVPNASA